MRPLTVTLVAWALILGSMAGFALLALSTAHYLGNEKPPGAYASASTAAETGADLPDEKPGPKLSALILGGVGLFVAFLAGKFILDGENWARMLYAVAAVLNVGASYYVAPKLLMLGVLAVPPLLLLPFLFLPRANRYFHHWD